MESIKQKVQTPQARIPGEILPYWALKLFAALQGMAF